MKAEQIFPGAIVGNWSVTDFTYLRGKRRYWRCQCSCGTIREVQHSNLAAGTSTSCGCSKRTHGHTLMGASSITHSCWKSMVARCTSPANLGYQHYGAKGITVCDRWRYGEDGLSGFECFLADMGERPSKGHSIDRIDNSKGYEPGNCRWATRSEQALNRRSTTTYIFNGKPMLLREISAITGIPYDALRWRVRRAGISVAEAVKAPVQKGTRFSRPIPLRLLVYEGEVLTVKQIAQKTGVNYNSLRARLAAGEPLATALR